MDEVDRYFMPIIKKQITHVKSLVDNFSIINGSTIKEHTEMFQDVYEKLRGKVDGSQIDSINADFEKIMRQEKMNQEKRVGDLVR